jgi:hypothetical protein
VIVAHVRTDRCTFPASYILSCHVGMHRDARDNVPEFIAERYSVQMAGLSEAARTHRCGLCRPGQGCVITPEFGHRWRLRPCRDIGHMAWNQVAHVTPRLSDEEQVLGDAGGGVVKNVVVSQSVVKNVGS